MPTIVLVLTTPDEEMDPQHVRQLLERILRAETTHSGFSVHAADYKGPLPEWAGGVSAPSLWTANEKINAAMDAHTNTPKPRARSKGKSIIQQFKEHRSARKK